jgi:hypothetical protein
MVVIRGVRHFLKVQLTEDLVKTGHDMHGAKVTVTPGTARRADLQDTKVDVKVVLGGLWISTLFVFAYVDILGFWRADVIKGALDGEVPDAGFTINQTFLAFTTIYILIPSLMIVVSLIAPARINRLINLIASSLYAASVVVGVVGETWGYYIIGSLVEVLLLLSIARLAWTWPRHPTQVVSTDV